MIAGKHNFTADEGSTFTFRVEIRDDAGELMDLSGWSGEFAAAAVNAPETVVFDGVVVIEASGIEVTVAAADMSASGTFVYDLRISKDDVVYSVLFGSLTVRGSVFV